MIHWVFCVTSTPYCRFVSSCATGVCDLVLLHSEEFGQGLGLDVHLRTKERYGYAYIESAAIRIGDNVLEVSSYGEYMLNGVERAELPFMMEDMYNVTHVAKNMKEHEFIIKKNLYGNEQIVVKTHKEMVTVKVEDGTATSFGDSVGLMGSFPKGSLLGRDGNMIHDFNDFGREWQVSGEEPKLFETIRVPQHPQACVMPVAMKADGRRRLGGSVVSQEAAETACTHLVDEQEKNMCIFDVMAMGDLDVAAAASAF